MWSFWLIFCILYALWWLWIRALYKLPDGRNWLWGKLDLAVVGRTSQFSSVTQSCPTLWPQGLWRQASLSIINSQSLLKLMSFESEMPSNQLILCHSLLLPSIFPSIRVFSNESTLRIRWPKYWNFSFSISPYNEYSGLISIRINWFDLLVVQRTLKSLLQHHSSKASAFSLLYGPALTSIHDCWKKP